MALQAGDILFLDTNILLTATDVSRKSHTRAKDIFKTSLEVGFHLCLSGQVVREYLVVATRDRNLNGLGLVTEDAVCNIESFLKRAVLLEETEAVSGHLVTLIRDHNLVGSRIHDANIVATMMAHSISKLITENPKDFREFTEASVLDLSDPVG